jgi:hypothetical protein
MGHIGWIWNGARNYVRKYENDCFISPIKNNFSQKYYEPKPKINIYSKNNFLLVVEEELNWFNGLLKRTYFYKYLKIWVVVNNQVAE